jgi:hypothetical protein
MNKKSIFTCFFVASIVIQCHACGLLWVPPSAPISNAASDGTLSYWTTLTTINPQGIQIPILIGFSSSSAVPSLIGPGWTLPIIDSNIIQVDQNDFLLTLPDGRKDRLTRDISMPDLLKGNGWVANISGNKIECKAECGWSLSFTHGKLTSITTPNSKVFTISRDDIKKDYHISDGIQEVLAVSPFMSKDGKSAYKVSAGRSDSILWLGKRPFVQSIGGQRVIGSMVESLSGIEHENLLQNTFAFDVDKNIRPTLKVLDHAFVWNSDSGQLLSDGVFEYKTRSVGGVNCLSRETPDGDCEVFGSDNEKGIFVRKNFQRPFEREKIFTSGVLAGKPRSIDISMNGNTWEEKKRFSYDTSGNAIRVISKVNNITSEVNIAKKNIKTFDGKTGKLLLQLDFNSNGDVAKISTHGKCFDVNHGKISQTQSTSSSTGEDQQSNKEIESEVGYLLSKLSFPSQNINKK